MPEISEFTLRQIPIIIITKATVYGNTLRHRTLTTRYCCSDTKLPGYYQYPKFLLSADLSQTAKTAYMLLYDRARLSRENGWEDGSGRIYVHYTVKKLAEALVRGLTATKEALGELDRAGLLCRAHDGFSRPSLLYVKLPNEPDLRPHGADSRPSEGRFSVSEGGGFPAPNKNIMNKNLWSKKSPRAPRLEDYSFKEGESF